LRVLEEIVGFGRIAWRVAAKARARGTCREPSGWNYPLGSAAFRNVI
jgi:hypothetical protein